MRNFARVAKVTTATIDATNIVRHSLRGRGADWRAFIAGGKTVRDHGIGKRRALTKHLQFSLLHASRSWVELGFECATE